MSKKGAKKGKGKKEEGSEEEVEDAAEAGSQEGEGEEKEDRPKTPEEHKQRQVYFTPPHNPTGRNIPKIPRKHRDLDDVPDHFRRNSLEENKGGKSVRVHRNATPRDRRRGAENRSPFLFL